LGIGKVVPAFQNIKIPNGVICKVVVTCQVSFANFPNRNFDLLIGGLLISGNPDLENTRVRWLYHFYTFLNRSQVSVQEPG